MKSLSFIVCTVFCFSAFAQPISDGESWKSVSQKGTGKLSVIYYECPNLIEESSGKVKGVCVDILNDFAAFVKNKYNKTVEITFVSKQSDFGQFLKNVKSSANVIGVSNTTINDERKAQMKFSPYFLKTPLVILTNKSTPNFSTLKELTESGLGGQVEKQTSYAAFMDNLKAKDHPKLSIEYLPSTAAAVQKLSASNKYFSVMDFTEYLGEVKLNPNIKRQPINLNHSVELGFVMSKRSDWDAIFNEFLTESYRNSIPYKKSISKNLGANFLSLVK